MDNTRFDKGMAMLAKIDGIGGQEVVNCLEGIALDFGISLWGHLFTARPGFEKQRNCNSGCTYSSWLCQAPAKGAYSGSLECWLQKGGSYRDNYPVGGLCRLPGRTQWSFSRQGGVWESARHILIDWHF